MKDVAGEIEKSGSPQGRRNAQDDPDDGQAPNARRTPISGMFDGLPLFSVREFRANGGIVEPL